MSPAKLERDEVTIGSSSRFRFFVLREQTRFALVGWRKPASHPAITAGVFLNHALSDDVRRDLVFNEGDAVAQLQFALLQALHLNEVGARRRLERRDRGIEVAMLLLQARKLRPKLAFFLLCHRRLDRALAGRPARFQRMIRKGGCRLAIRNDGLQTGKLLWIIAFWLMSDKPARLLRRQVVHSGDFRQIANPL